MVKDKVSIPLPLAIIGTGMGLPSQMVTSAEVDKKLGLKTGVTERVSGLSQRYFLAEGESADAMHSQAIQMALEHAKLTADDIDCVINASATMRQALPFNAAHSLRLLKSKRAIAAFDVNMTCLSALRGLDLAALLLPTYPTILLVSCDVASVGLDWQDFHSSTIFGDGAAALVLQQSSQGGILASEFVVYPEGYEYCTIRAGGYACHPAQHPTDFMAATYFHMNGSKLYRLVADKLPELLDSVLDKAQLTWEQIDWIVPHQASRGALSHMASRLAVVADKVVNIFGIYGNQVAVSIPTALHQLMTHYPVKSGDNVLLCGTSAGVGIGAVIWQIP